MKYLVQSEKLPLKYIPDNGAWTFHLQIPNTKEIKGKWGTIKVSGCLDDYKIVSKNLAPMGSEEKILAVNATIRKAIKKEVGDYIKVTLYLDDPKEEIDVNEIIKTFKEFNVFDNFENLSEEEKKNIIDKILAEKSEEKQIKKLLEYVNLIYEI